MIFKRRFWPLDADGGCSQNWKGQILPFSSSEIFLPCKIIMVKHLPSKLLQFTIRNIWLRIDMKPDSTKIAAMWKSAPPCRGNRSSLIVVYLHFSDWSPADLRMVMMRIHCSVVFCMEKCGLASSAINWNLFALRQLNCSIYNSRSFCCLSPVCVLVSRSRLVLVCDLEIQQYETPAFRPIDRNQTKTANCKRLLTSLCWKICFAGFDYFCRRLSNVFTVLDSCRATTRSVQEYDPAALCLKYLVQDQIFSLSHLSHF